MIARALLLDDGDMDPAEAVEIYERILTEMEADRTEVVRLLAELDAVRAHLSTLRDRARALIAKPMREEIHA